jgi:hypothetical protein
MKDDTTYAKTVKHKGRNIVVNEITAYEDYFCAYVSLRDEEPAHKIARQSPTNLPVDVHGGFTYGSDKLPHPESVEGDYWIGWDYAHSFSEDPDLEEVVSDAKTVAEKLGLVTVKQAAREKLSIEPDWYKKGLRQLYK